MFHFVDEKFTREKIKKESEVRTINKIEEIKRLFYKEHLKGTEIAKQIGVNKSYVTKIIQKDERYINEKDKQTNKNTNHL